MGNNEVSTLSCYLGSFLGCSRCWGEGWRFALCFPAAGSPVVTDQTRAAGGLERCRKPVNVFAECLQTLSLYWPLVTSA